MGNNNFTIMSLSRCDLFKVACNTLTQHKERDNKMVEPRMLGAGRVTLRDGCGLALFLVCVYIDLFSNMSLLTS